MSTGPSLDDPLVVEVTQKVNERLARAGEKERLKDLLRHKLIQAGWRETLKTHIQNVLKAKMKEQGGDGGPADGVTLEGLVNEVMPFAQESIPEAVKLELISLISQVVAKSAE